MLVDHKQQAGAIAAMPTVSRDSIYFRLRGYYPMGPILKGEPAYGWKSMIGQELPMRTPTPLNLEAAAAIKELTTALANTQYALEIARASLRCRHAGLPVEHAQHNIDTIEKALSLSRHLIADYDLITVVPEDTL